MLFSCLQDSTNLLYSYITSSSSIFRVEATIWSAAPYNGLLTFLPAFVAVSLTPTTWARLIKCDLCLLRRGQTERLRIDLQVKDKGYPKDLEIAISSRNDTATACRFVHVSILFFRLWITSIHGIHTYNPSIMRL